MHILELTDTELGYIQDAVGRERVKALTDASDHVLAGRGRMYKLYRKRYDTLRNLSEKLKVVAND